MRYDYLAARTEIGGKEYDTILTVEAYDYQNKMKTYRLENIEITPVDLVAETDRKAVQYRLRTGPRNSVASSSNSILADDIENVNAPNNANSSINSNIRYSYGKTGVNDLETGAPKHQEMLPFDIPMKCMPVKQ